VGVWLVDEQTGSQLLVSTIVTKHFTHNPELLPCPLLPTGQWPLDRCPSVLQGPCVAGVFLTELT
jgi:hypothetical protein